MNAPISKWLIRFITASLMITLTLLSASPAFAVTDQQDICEDGGGVWTGADAFNGSCEYPIGNSNAEDGCGEHAVYTQTFSAGAQTSDHCAYEPTSIGAAGKEGSGSNHSVTLLLGQGKNGSATFSPGACAQKCTISANLPRAAKNLLPSGVAATLSVRMLGGTGSYLVCFKTAGLENPAIYKFVAGTWVRLVLRSSGNNICAAATGNGSFYLGEG